MIIRHQLAMTTIYTTTCQLILSSIFETFLFFFFHQLHQQKKTKEKKEKGLFMLMSLQRVILIYLELATIVLYCFSSCRNASVHCIFFWEKSRFLVSNFQSVVILEGVCTLVLFAICFFCQFFWGRRRRESSLSLAYNNNKSWFCHAQGIYILRKQDKE